MKTKKVNTPGSLLSIRKIQAALAALTLIIASTGTGFLPTVFAGSLTHASVLLYNMNAGGTSQVAFAFTTGSAGATSVSLNFSGWTGGAAGSVNTVQAIATTGCTAITGASAVLPGTLAASGSSSTVTITGVTALSASTSYCAILTSASAVTNPTATGTYNVAVTAGSDSTTTTIDVISNDQVVVSATVPAAFTMALNSNTDTFGSNLSSSTTTGTTGITATINTNAKSGWFLWGADNNTGLRSPAQSYTIASKTPGTNASLSNGSEGYLTAVPAGGITQGGGAGTTSATTAYASSGAGNGSGLDATERQLASSTGTASGAVVTVKEYATIASTTPAASDYTDTITLVGAGSF